MSRRLLNLINNNQPQLPANKKFLADVMSCIERCEQEGRRKGINLHSKKDASTETINYVESKDFEPFVCCVDIPMLKEQLQANPDDTVKICYGNENALKIESGKVTQVIALLEDEELDNMTE